MYRRLASVPSLRGALRKPPLYLGQSINGKNMIRKLGTICCHIQPQNGGSPSSSSASGNTPKYGLSGCHVVLSTSISETSSREVVCPGSLDMPAALSRELPGGPVGGASCLGGECWAGPFLSNWCR
jgi:hypothetical protein